MKKGVQPIIIVTIVLLYLLLPSCKPANIDAFSPAHSVAASTLVSIEINPSSPSMAPGTNLQLEAVGTFANKTTNKLSENVKWSSSNPEIANVDSTGLVTALTGSAGSATITALSGGISGSTTITLSPVVSISLIPSDTTIAPGTTQKFTAVGTLQNSATQDLTQSATWLSSDPSATINNGLASGAAIGTSTITATVGPITGTSSLTVANVQSIAVTPFNSTIARGTSQQFTASATLSNFAIQNVTSFATWSTFPSGIAIINNAGMAAAISTGSAVITAALGGVFGTAALIVTEPHLVSLAVTPVNQSIAAGGVQQFIAVATFSDGTRHDITADVIFVSSNPSVAIVNFSGTNGLVAAVAAGTTGISASFSGITSNVATLIVIQQISTIASITITPLAPSVPVGHSLQFTAQAVSSSGTILEDITSAATWTSSNGEVAFVSQGLATAFSPGVTTITASFGNISGNTVLNVTPF